MLSRLLYFLCILSVATHALLPPGYMFAQTGDDGSMAIVICTGHGPRTVNLDPGDGTVPAEQDSRDSKICDYATMGAAALVSEAPYRLATEARYAAVVYRVVRNHFRATPKPGAASARGPPAALTQVA